MAEGLPRRIFAGWRGLGVFWALVLLLLGGGALWLDRLGPPKPHETVAEAPAAPEAAVPTPAEAELATPPAPIPGPLAEAPAATAATPEPSPAGLAPPPVEAETPAPAVADLPAPAAEASLQTPAAPLPTPAASFKRRRSEYGAAPSAHQQRRLFELVARSWGQTAGDLPGYQAAHSSR